MHARTHAHAHTHAWFLHRKDMRAVVTVHFGAEKVFSRKHTLLIWVYRLLCWADGDSSEGKSFFSNLIAKCKGPRLG